MSESDADELLDEYRLEAGILGWPMAVRGTLERDFFPLETIELYLEDRLGGKLTSSELKLLKFIGGTMVRDWNETKEDWLHWKSMVEINHSARSRFDIAMELEEFRTDRFRRLIELHDSTLLRTKRRRLLYSALDDFWTLVVSHYELVDFTGGTHEGKT